MTTNSKIDFHKPSQVSGHTHTYTQIKIKQYVKLIPRSSPGASKFSKCSLQMDTAKLCDNESSCLCRVRPPELLTRWKGSSEGIAEVKLTGLRKEQEKKRLSKINRLEEGVGKKRLSKERGKHIKSFMTVFVCIPIFVNCK